MDNTAHTSVGGVLRPAVASSEEALAMHEEELERWAARLQSEARLLELHKEEVRTAREQRHRTNREIQDVLDWEEELRREVTRATRQLELQKRQQVDKCAQFESAISNNIAKLQQMQADVRRRAAALESAYETTVNRIRDVCEAAIAERQRSTQSTRCQRAAHDALSSCGMSMGPGYVAAQGGATRSSEHVQAHGDSAQHADLSREGEKSNSVACMLSVTDSRPPLDTTLSCSSDALRSCDFEVPRGWQST